MHLLKIGQSMFFDLPARATLQTQVICQAGDAAVEFRLPERLGAGTGDGDPGTVAAARVAPVGGRRAAWAGRQVFQRSERRGGGQEGVSTCRSRWSAEH